MTIEQFWAFYDEHNKVDRETLLALKEFLLNNTIETCPDIEEYEMAISDIIFQGFDNKLFKECIEITRLLFENFNDIYMMGFEYLDIYLIDYYCFHNKPEKVIEHFGNFDKDPMHNFGFFIRAFNILIFNNYNDLLHSTCLKNYDKLDKEEGFILDPVDPIANFIFLNTINEYIKNTKGSFNRNELTTILDNLNIGYNYTDFYISAIEKGIFNKFPDKPYMLELFNSNRDNFNILVQQGFYRYMLNKGVTYPASNKIFKELNWILFGDADRRNEVPFPQFFEMKLKRFEKRLSYLKGFIINDDTITMFALLWGSVYYYDFLKENDLVPLEVYDKFQKIVARLKDNVIFADAPNLWKYSFVHNWEKPDSISEENFQREKELFKSTIRRRITNLKEMKYFIENIIGKESEYYLFFKQRLLKHQKEESKSNKKIFKELGLDE